MDFLGLLDFSRSDGLLPAIAQDDATGDVLMVAHMSEESLRRTIETGEAVYWSRSRGRLWHKGEESGHVQVVRSILTDCDGDVLLLRVEQRGPGACHTGRRSCFFRRLTPEGGVEEVGERVFDPDRVYGR